jgi:hypothetical protein
MRIFGGSLLITAPPTLCVLWYPVIPKCRSEPVSARPISLQRYFVIPSSGGS